MIAITGGRVWLLGVVVLSLGAVFVFVGGVALALGCATTALLIVVAARARPDEQIEVAEAGPAASDGLLVLAVDPIEDPRTAALIAEVADPSRIEPRDRGLLVIAPARSSRLDRWADDIERARFDAQRSLTVSLASLAAAGVRAEGRVGDGDALRAAEDALRSYAASEVIVVARPGTERRGLAELERRLPRPLRRIEIDPG